MKKQKANQYSSLAYGQKQTVKSSLISDISVLKTLGSSKGLDTANDTRYKNQSGALSKYYSQNSFTSSIMPPQTKVATKITNYMK